MNYQNLLVLLFFITSFKSSVLASNTVVKSRDITPETKYIEAKLKDSIRVNSSVGRNITLIVEKAINNKS